MACVFGHQNLNFWSILHTWQVGYGSLLQNSRTPIGVAGGLGDSEGYRSHASGTRADPQLASGGFPCPGAKRNRPKNARPEFKRRMTSPRVHSAARKILGFCKCLNGTIILECWGTVWSQQPEESFWGSLAADVRPREVPSSAPDFLSFFLTAFFCPWRVP